MKNNNLSVLRKLIGKKMFIIDDIKKYTGYIAQVVDVQDEGHVLIKNETSELVAINIFNIRSVPYEW